MKSTFKLLVLAGAMASLMAAEAQASVISYKLDQSNITSVMPNGTTYATVTIQDGLDHLNSTVLTGGSDIRFTVDVVNTAFTIGANFGIQEFGFNQASGAPTVADNNIFTLNGWSGNVAPPPNALDGFGKYVVSTTGTGTTRMDPLVFWITGVTGDTASSYVGASTGNTGSGQQNEFFATHIAGFTTSNATITSGYFAGSTSIPPGTGGNPVPLPAGVWLFMSGLMGLFYNGKKKSHVLGLAS